MSLVAPAALRCVRCERIASGRLRRGLCPSCSGSFYRERAKGESPAEWLGVPEPEPPTPAPREPVLMLSAAEQAALDAEVLATARYSFFFMLVSDREPATTLAELCGPRPKWYREAACLGSGCAPFFPIKLDGDKGAKAKAVCASCQVREECLSYALGDPDVKGTWGDQ